MSATRYPCHAITSRGTTCAKPGQHTRANDTVRLCGTHLSTYLRDGNVALRRLRVLVNHPIAGEVIVYEGEMVGLAQ